MSQSSNVSSLFLFVWGLTCDNGLSDGDMPELMARVDAWPLEFYFANGYRGGGE